MILQGLVLLWPLPLAIYCSVLSFGGESGGYGPTGTGTIGPRSLLPAYAVSPALTGE